MTKIILAEHAADIRFLMETALRLGAHHVTSVGDGASALEDFARDPAPLLILDWMMLEVDGLEVCRRLRQFPEGRDTSIRLFTGRDTPEDLSLALDDAARDQQPAGRGDRGARAPRQ